MHIKGNGQALHIISPTVHLMHTEYLTNLQTFSTSWWVVFLRKRFATAGWPDCPFNSLDVRKVA